jgi:hypothetical protein
MLQANDFVSIVVAFVVVKDVSKIWLIANADQEWHLIYRKTWTK